MNRTPTTARMLAVAGLAMLLVVPACAQTPAPPDLSGTWKLNLAKSKLGKYMKVESETVVVTSSGSTIEFRFTTDGKSARDATYTLDGNEHFFSEMVSTPIHTRGYYTAQWQGAVLVIRYRIRIETSDAPTVGAAEGNRATERWSASPNGRAVARTFTSSDSVGNDTRMYDKQ